MATFLASIFLNNARAPLARASERFGRNLMGDGVRALSMEHLVRALEGAIDEVARTASLPRARVVALLDHDGMLAQADRIDTAQAASLAAIRKFDFTVAAFTVLNPRASASSHLVDLARHFARDRYIAEALDSLATEIARWEELLSAGCAALAQDTSLEARWRAKKMFRMMLAWGAVLVASAAIAVILYKTARNRAEKAEREQAAARVAMEKTRALIRVDDVIAAATPCTPADAQPADRDLATPEQTKKLDARKQRCETERQQKAHLDRCAEVATNVEQGKDVQASVDVSSDAVDLLHRVVTSQLTIADLGVTKMACESSPSEARLWATLAKASAPIASLWGRAESVSPKLVPLVSTGANTLPKSSQLSLSFRAETVATHAVKSGVPEEAPRARSLCELKKALGMPLGLGCQGALAMPKLSDQSRSRTKRPLRRASSPRRHRG